MRFLILAAALSISSCAKEEPAPSPVGLSPGTYAAGERDGLCISGLAPEQRAGFVVYGPGDRNCSASGRISQTNGSWSLVPAGEGECRIPLLIQGGTIALGGAGPGCAYYCAPGVTFEGKTFERIEHHSQSVTDLAGDRLC